MCCMAKDCKRVATTRGLCASHFTKTAKQVRDGIFTWEELEAKGMVQRARGVNRKFNKWRPSA